MSRSWIAPSKTYGKTYAFYWGRCNYFIKNTLQRLNDRDNHLGSTGTTPLWFFAVESESLAFCAKTILRVGQLPDINKIKAIANILYEEQTKQVMGRSAYHSFHVLDSFCL
ncbi:MAG: hypothetical protein J1F40_00005 [Prevotellaceae bacterium]|nr:hypothetical protein [Prevotellaceae bacterium]